MMSCMKNEPLYIPPTKRLGGLLVVYCRLCKTNIYDVCKKSGKSIKQCPNGSHHSFKCYVSVPGTKNERRTKILETRDLEIARRQALEFKKEVQENAYQKNDEVSIKTKVNRENKIQEVNVPRLLVHAMSRYIGWLHNENVPAHLEKERSEEHIKDVERAFRSLAICLKENGYNLEIISMDDINDEVIGYVYSYLESKNMANRTFNKHIGYFSSFLKWYALEYDHQIRNWFDRVKRKKLNPTPEAITKSEYEALLKQITPDNGVKEYRGGIKETRNVYRPWLVDGFRLALETGRRREEIVNLKWSNILESEGFQYIKVEDFKVNRIQNRTSDKERKFVYVPVTDSLKELLNEMGYEKYANTDNYILAPEIKTSRGRVMSDILSRGFSHFYEQLKTGRSLTFKCLRKTYITNLEIFMGNGNTKAITGHSDDQVIQRNYIDKKEIAKAARSFNVFSTEAERVDDLKEIRTATNEKTQNVNLEV